MWQHLHRLWDAAPSRQTKWKKIHGAAFKFWLGKSVCCILGPRLGTPRDSYATLASWPQYTHLRRLFRPCLTLTSWRRHMDLYCKTECKITERIEQNLSETALSSASLLYGIHSVFVAKEFIDRVFLAFLKHSRRVWGESWELFIAHRSYQHFSKDLWFRIPSGSSSYSSKHWIMKTSHSCTSLFWYHMHHANEPACHAKKAVNLLITPCLCARKETPKAFKPSQKHNTEHSDDLDGLACTRRYGHGSACNRSSVFRGSDSGSGDSLAYIWYSFDYMCIPCLKTLKTRLKTRSGPRFALISGSIWSTWLNSVQVSPDVDIKSQATMPSQGILVFPSISQLLDAANQPWACNSIDIRDLSWQSQSKKH